MEIQVLAHGPAAAISRCEVRFGFASRKHNIGDIHELKHDGRRSNKRQLLMLKPSEQRLAFMTIAYRCQAGNLMEAQVSNLCLVVKKSASTEKVEQICIVPRKKSTAGMNDFSPHVLATIPPVSRLELLRGDEQPAILFLHVEVGN